ncbi:MAG: hypothetical protein LUH53_04480 [Lachnospiraceae bacterium]|nr:hypothetical protein [Lachnospiraceae bacterium]
MEALYDGLIYPAEQVVPDTPRYHETVKAIYEIMCDFEGSLDKEIYKRIRSLLDLEAESSDIMEMEFFKYGLSLGMKLSQESDEMIKRFLSFKINKDMNNSDSDVMTAPQENIGQTMEEAVQ